MEGAVFYARGTPVSRRKRTWTMSGETGGGGRERQETERKREMRLHSRFALHPPPYTRLYRGMWSSVYCIPQEEDLDDIEGDNDSDLPDAPEDEDWFGADPE